LTRLTDYDDSTLDYTYDASGNVLTMNDYHGSNFVYTYTDTHQLSTLTAPGNKTWTWTYNDLDQPVEVDIPNGMTTVYGYDARNRLTAIEHKDGVDVLDGFYYTLDKQGNVLSVSQENGSTWDYGYDGRYRLTSAVWGNDETSPSITTEFAYAYDGADNMVTKVWPFFDDFNDGNYTGWSVWGGLQIPLVRARTWAGMPMLRITIQSARTCPQMGADSGKSCRWATPFA